MQINKAKQKNYPAEGKEENWVACLTLTNATFPFSSHSVFCSNFLFPNKLAISSFLLWFDVFDRWKMRKLFCLIKSILYDICNIEKRNMNYTNIFMGGCGNAIVSR